MGINRILLRIVLVSVVLFSLGSCQTLITWYVGVKKPHAYVTQKDRLKYYKPFVEEHYATEIYTMKDTASLFKAFRNFSNFLIIYLEDTQTDSVYAFEQCYDDMEYVTESINSLTLDKELLIPITPKKDSVYRNYLFWKDFIPKRSELVYAHVDKDKTTTKRWNIYMVTGEFYGNRLRRKVLPITTIEDLNQLTILDFSINDTIPD